MFQKKKNKTEKVDIPPFVPKFYIVALTKDGHKYYSKKYEDRSVVELLRSAIADAPGQWAEIGDSLVLKSHIVSITVQETIPFYRRDLGWG